MPTLTAVHGARQTGRNQQEIPRRFPASHAPSPGGPPSPGGRGPSPEGAGPRATRTHATCARDFTPPGRWFQ